jgi:S1-C subfamily serine protease
MQLKTAIAVVGVSALTTGVVTGWVLSGRPTMTAPSVTEQAQPAGRSSGLPPAAALPDLSTVAEAALKVSANITSTTVSGPRDDFFSQFFGGGVRFQQPPTLGSGVLVSREGYVLTNTHVIGNAGAQVRVTLDDGREREGRLIGIDDVSDLAVVQVETSNVAPLPWGDSSKLRVAEWVMAVGNPFQLSGTVTLGIVSNVNRSAAQVGSEYSDFIQTDAAINPGNSGGALVNARGELVGINTMIYSSSGGYQGIGFAIPSNTAREIMNELIKNGVVRWGSLGAGRTVQWYEIDRTTARQNDLGDVEGLLVRQMLRESPLYTAGLRPRDIVVRFNGQPVTTLEQLNRLVIRAKPGSRVPMEVVRDGRPITIDVPIRERRQLAAVR